MAPTNPRKYEAVQQLSNELGACGLLCLLSIPGVILSLFLTLVKFRSDYRCDYAMLSACSIGRWFDCNHVLSSDASLVFKLPISAYSTGYYLAVLGLAGAALWRPRLLSVLRPVLLWLGWIGLLVVLGLATYTVFGLREGCSYCFIIYGLTGAIFCITALMHPQGHWQGLRTLFVPWRPRQGGVLLLTCLAFLALISVQMVEYRRSAASVEFDERCLVHGNFLPETHLRTRAPRLTAQISLFVDFACHHCRREFEFWQNFVTANPDEYVLELYHFAREGECMGGAKRGFSGLSSQHFSCLAAQAAECAEKLRPGSGVPMASALFALQDSTSTYFTERSVRDAAASIGFTNIPTDTFDHPFYTCLRGDEQVTRHIAGHTRFILESGIVDPPVTYITSYDADGMALPRTVQIQGAKRYSSALRTLQEARKAALEDSTAKPPVE